jgi:cytidylate kinase
MIITIDGPAGTGKSTVARAVAEKLGYDFLDTGAMYRAIGLEAVRRHANLEDQRELGFIARHTKLEFDWAKRPPAVLLNGESVGHLVRGGEATRAASYVATVPTIREMLVRQQQQIGQERPDLVTEGRDQGSVVFPQAELKFFLDATPAERARRRVAQLRLRGEIVDYNDVLNQILDRDHRDSSRTHGPLIVPKDAEVIDTDRMGEQDVIDRIIDRAREHKERPAR